MAGLLGGGSETAYARATKRKTAQLKIIFSCIKLLRKPWPCIHLNCIVSSHKVLFHGSVTAAYRRCLGRTILASLMFHEESSAFCGKRRATEGRIQHSRVKPSGRIVGCCNIIVECEPAQILRMVHGYTVHQ